MERRTSIIMSWDKYGRINTNLPTLEASQVHPVLNHKVRDVCKKPYRNHPKGCPNYGKRDICPPKAKLLHEILDCERMIFCVWNKFDLDAHVNKMKIKHPNWTIYQLRNCLYWQGAARKQLRILAERLLKDYKGMMVLYCPEACGVDVTATMKTVGIELEWPPEKYTYQVALLGYPA